MEIFSQCLAFSFYFSLFLVFRMNLEFCLYSLMDNEWTNWHLWLKSTWQWCGHSSAPLRLFIRLDSTNVVTLSDLRGFATDFCGLSRLYLCRPSCQSRSNWSRRAHWEWIISLKSLCMSTRNTVKHDYFKLDQSSIFSRINLFRTCWLISKLALKHEITKIWQTYFWYFLWLNIKIGQSINNSLSGLNILGCVITFSLGQLSIVNYLKSPFLWGNQLILL